LKHFLFRVPPGYQSLIDHQIGVIHYQRMRIVVPLLAVLDVIFLFLDTTLLGEPGNSFLPWVYIVEDVIFLFVQLGFLVWIFRGPRKAPSRLVYGYVAFILVWGCVAGNVEFFRTGGLNTIFLTMLSVAALGLFSIPGILALILGSLSFYVLINLVWLAGAPFPLEKYFAFFALPFLAFAVSQTLYAAVVRNLIANHELELANAELKEVRLNLIRQDKLASLGVLSAGIAHEINNPLAFIKSNVAALEKNLAELSGPPSLVAENQVILAETKEGFRRIGEVVQALGSFARDVPTGQTDPYDLNQGIRATLVMTRHETSSDIVVDTDLTTLPLISARGSEINQVLLNLLMNAIQAVRMLPPGEVRLVMVRTKLEDHSVVAEVSNSGPPVPQELREKIFEPFFTTKAPGAGMGLGLSLSWQIIVGRHGGELELDEGRPVTFRLRLPRNRVSST